MMEISDNLKICLNTAWELASRKRHQFITPEHLLFAISSLDAFQNAVSSLPREAVSDFMSELNEAIDEMEHVPEDIWESMKDENGYRIIETSSILDSVYHQSLIHAGSAGRDTIEVSHILFSLFDAEETMAAYLLHSLIENKGEFMARFTYACESGDEGADAEEDQYDYAGAKGTGKDRAHSGSAKDWHREVVCINDIVDSHNPLIGREKELERTIQVLCRKDKNNPLHIGEPGVGKTAIVYGLTRMINEGRVPDRLKGAKIYRMELGSVVAGTRYRGDFEEKLQKILEGVASEGNGIIYIDEIHTMMGAGATGEGNLDASNLLKRYLEESRIRFIGATTFEEYKRSISRNRAVSRRFQEIEICEPSESEAVEILEQLRKLYESYHGITYAPGVMEYAVKMSARHLHGRFLPDKAIDLIDEAGAYRELHPDDISGGIVDVDLVAEVLAKVARVDALAMKDETIENTRSLSDRVLANLYGQDDAVKDVVESVLMSRAGLTEENRPLGSFLFVGPTGVGKTELARVLAREMGIGLVRFDMSEYAEKHTVAKLIGSPAGYVGYEDGGLLTDAIRKQPNCVLLLDEIEKAHQDIYNILLQVMDYASLTDNQGRTADFSNVVIVMTSNAGAQFAARASVGFGNNVSSGQAMMKEVKRVFKPEFLNRLTAIEVFRDMDETMASMILDKALRGLLNRLSAKNVELELSDSARKILMKRGLTREYGARELHRVIESLLTRPLSREILFGELRNGGKVYVESEGENNIRFEIS